jgi:hypothetical protein
MKSRSLLSLSAALIAGVCLLLNIPRESPVDSSNSQAVDGHGQHAAPSHSCADCQAAKPVFPAAKTQPLLNPIFKLTGGQGGLTVPFHAFDALKGQAVGAELAIQAAGLELAGTLTHVSEVGDRGNYIVELNDSTGRMHVATSDRRLVGEVFFYGDSRMLQIREYSMDSLQPMVVIESGGINEFYCVPSGTMYGPSGLMTGAASGLLEPLSSTSPPFTGEDPTAPYEIESLAGSAHVLYLDFDGGVFGQSDSPLLPGLVAALPHARVNDEAWVRAVHARVAEDFAPFDINVTTTRSVFEAAATLQRIHVVITPTDDAAPGTGGVAKIGSFGVDESPIVWVFNNTECAVASTISHEAGHALGLDDDGITDGAVYYGGHNGGYSFGWAPIMGAPWADAEGELLYDEVDQWSTGEYTDASNVENDLLLIAQQLGYVVDDFVDSYEDALVGGAGSISGTEANESGNLIRTGAGLISETDDADVFIVEVLYDGLLTLTVAPLDVDAELLEAMGETGISGRLETGARTQGANLAVDIELVNDTGVRVATGTANGDAELGSLITLADLSAGTYYLIIDGAGRSSATDGFTDYASLGEYSVQAEMLAGPILVSGSNKGYQPISNGSETITFQNATDFEFGAIGASKQNTFQIFNPESQNITVTSITLADGTDFVVSNVPTTVKAGTGKDFYIDFKPAGSGYLASDVVTITYDAIVPVSPDYPTGIATATYSFTVGGTAVASATRDNYEINDSPSSLPAANLTTVEDTWLSAYKGPATLQSIPFQSGGDPRDWYHFTVDAADDLVTVDINYDSTLYDLTFTLKAKLNFSYNELISTSAATGVLNYVIPADKKGVYTEFYVLVEAADKSVLNSYDLKWNAISLSADLGEDFYGNPSRETAFDLSGQSGAPLSSVLGRGVLNGEDWYKITVADDRSNAYNRQIHVAAVFNDIEGEDPVNIDIEVFAEMDDPFLAQLNEFFELTNAYPISSVSTDADKEVVTVASTSAPLFDSVGDDRVPLGNNNVTGVVSGTYYVRVSSPDAYTGSTYDLTVATLSDDNYEVIDDAGTENDSREDAFDLGETIIGRWLSDVDGAGTMATYISDPATPEDTFVNAGDDDWYQFSLPSVETVTQFSVEYQFVAEAGNVIVYDADGTELAGTSGSSLGVLTILNPASSTYYVEVNSTNTSVANLSGYDFRVTTSALPPVNEVEDDAYEDNDNYTQLYNLAAIEGLSLASLGGYGVQFDPDWYLIQVPAGATELQIDCLFDSSKGDLEIRLWKASGIALPISSVDITNGKRILWNGEDSVPIAAGNYSLEVSGDNLGNTYNLSWDVTRSDDNYEPNDDFASAYDLTATPRQWLNKVNGLGIQQDDDFYKIEVLAGAGTAELQIRTFFDPSEGDIDLDLYFVESDGSYSWIDQSVNGNTVEELTITNPPVGEYIVKLSYDNAGNEYDLWWAPFTQSEVDAIALAIDAYEPNDTLATAYALGGDQVILAGIEGQGTQGDDDWYAITVSNNNIGLDIECEFQPQNGDIDIELYDAFGGLLARSATDDGPSGPFDTAFENIGFGGSLPEGTYYIRVYGANLGNPYNLYWVERAPDAFEPNDSLEAAYDLGREAPDELATEEPPILRVEGTQSNDDWFEIGVVSDTAFLAVDLEYVHYFGNIDFEIYDAAGALFWSPPVAPDENRPVADELLNPFVESIFISVTAGTYYIKVFGGPATTYTEETPTYDTPAGDRWNSYTLDWAVVQDDALEFDRDNVVLIENDDRASVDGDPGHPSNLSGQDGAIHAALQYDDDWYQVTLDAGNQALAARIEYDHANSDIDLAIYDGAGVLLVPLSEPVERDPADITEEDPASKEDNRESYFYLAPTPVPLDTTYFLRVYGDGNRNSSYELIWTQAIGDDELEPNDDLASAVLILEDATYVNLVSRRSEPFDAFPSDPDLTRAIQFDDDWYQIDKEDGEVQLGVKIDFNSAKGDLGFAIYDAAGNELFLADGDIDDEFQIFWPSPLAGTYYVKVFGDNLGNDYTIEWASSFVDIYESSTGNNVIDDATDLLGQEGLRMKDGLGYATSGDDDWYQIEIATGDTGVIVEAFRDFAADDFFVMELFNSAHQAVAFATPEPNIDPAPTTQRIRYEGAAGIYYVHVFGGLMGNPYDLLWNSYKEDVLESSGEGAKIEKKHEQNDTPDDPRGLQLTSMNATYYPAVDGTHPDLELVLLDELTQADEDWYTFYVDDEDTFLGEPADDTLIINVEFEHIQGDVDMALYFLGETGGDAPVLVDTLDGSGDVMGLSKDDNEQIRIDTGLAWGKYLLCVYGHGVEDVKPDALPITRTIDPSTDDTTGLGNTYSLRWNSGYTDEFDTPFTNNDLASATDLGFLDDLNGPRERDDRFLTQFDEDWYQIEVRSDTVHQLYARIDFEHVKGDLTLRLLDENGNLLLESNTALDREVLLTFGDGTATYYLQVVGEDLGTPYNLYMRAYNDDIYEDNDTFETPADVRGEQDDLMTPSATGIENIDGTIFERGIISGIQLDDDYYLISVPNDSVHLNVRFFTNIGLAGDFDVGYTVLSIDEVARTTAATYYDLINPEASNYVIHVTGDDVGTPYDLVWEIDNVDQYDSRGGISYPNFTSNTVFDEVSQSSHNNDWENAYDLTQPERLAPTYDKDIKYKTAIRDLIHDEAVLATRFGDSGNNRNLAVGHATQQDEDWYRVQMPSWELVTAKQGIKSIQVLKRIYNTSLQVDLAYEHADGNIDVEIYDVDDLGDDDVTNDVLTLLSALSLADDNVDLESIRVPVDPLNEDRVYAIRVSGDNIGNDYSLIWEERTNDLYEINDFVDTSHDLTLSSDVGDAATGASDFSSTEGKWLHELWQHNDANGNGTIEAGEMMNRRYGNQSTDDWYAVAVSDGSASLDVQANFYADDNTDHEYDPDDLDFAVDLYRLVEDPILGVRKPILIGRINDNDKDTEPFPARPHPIDGDLDYPLTEPGGTIDPDTGERIEGGAITLPDTDGGIYFIRIFRDNRDHPYTFKWDDGEVDHAGDLVIVDDYLNGDWTYTPDLELPEDILNPGAGDADGNGYPDWIEYALTLEPAQAVPGLTAVLVQMVREAEVNGVTDEYYTVTYLRSTEAVVLGYEFTIIGGEILGSLTPAAEEQLISQELVAPGVERVVYRSDVPMDEAATYFFQLEVVPPAIP